jgi:hypothetical protein
MMRHFKNWIVKLFKKKEKTWDGWNDIARPKPTEPLSEFFKRHGISELRIPIECGGLHVCDHDYTFEMDKQMKFCTKCEYRRPIHKYWWEKKPINK